MFRTIARSLATATASLLLLVGCLVLTGPAASAQPASRCAASHHHGHHHKRHHHKHGHHKHGHHKHGHHKHGHHRHGHHPAHHHKHRAKHHHKHHHKHHGHRHHGAGHHHKRHHRNGSCHHRHHKHGHKHHHRHKHHHKHHHKHRSLAHRGARVVRIAASLRGTPYRWGATGPRAFDCSGFTSWVYRHVGVHLPRTAAEQARATKHVGHRSEMPGDLVFFAEHRRVYHVGIYAGHHRIWHAPHTGTVVHRERLWTSHYFVGRVR